MASARTNRARRNRPGTPTDGVRPGGLKFPDDGQIESRRRVEDRLRARLNRPGTPTDGVRPGDLKFPDDGQIESRRRIEDRLRAHLNRPGTPTDGVRPGDLKFPDDGRIQSRLRVEDRLEALTYPEYEDLMYHELQAQQEEREARLQHEEREASLQHEEREARRKASSVLTYSRENWSEDHVGGAAQPPSAQMVEELADSFSEQLLFDTETKKGVNDEVEERANNNTIFSTRQVGSYSKMSADEEEGMVKYRRFWEDVWGSSDGSFEDCTFVTPMLYTYGAIPAHATLFSCLQIFSIEVMENEVWRIRWPLEVYGFIAARDTVDHNRNLLFSRTRDDPQILTPQDPFLQLTGPCRPILLIDPVDFEIQLKVKGKTESEDETFMAKRFEYGRGFGQSGHVARCCWEGNFCTLEITSALLGSTVAATIISADIIEGSWPGNCGGRVVSRTAGIDEDFVLLDSGDGPMHVDPDGHITLQRGVVCVRRAGILTVSMQAYSEAGICVEDCVEFRPRDSLTSIGTCNLGFCTVMFIVGWSLAATKFEVKYVGN